MKKLLLSAALLAFAYGEAQVLQSDNFNSLTIGDVGTEFSNAETPTPGQGDWLTFISTGSNNASNSSFQIVQDGFDGNGLQLTGSDTAAGTRFMWKDGLATGWTSRTEGNNLIEVEFDYFTGGTTTSLNSFRVYIYSAEASPRVLAGMGITKNQTVSGVAFKNVVSGFYHWTSTPGTGTYSIALGPNATTPFTLPENTWVRMGFSFNTVNGEARWKVGTVDGTFSGNAQFPPVTAGVNPGEVNFLVIAGTGNTVASTSVFDGFVVKASATDSLLSLEQDFAAVNFKVYPNPANDIVNINAGTTLVKSLQVTDMNGRVVKNVSVNNLSQTSVNISDLNTGLYLLSVFTNEGVGTVKLVKN